MAAMRTFHSLRLSGHSVTKALRIAARHHLTINRGF
jgi:hypothetical protein